LRPTRERVARARRPKASGATGVEVAMNGMHATRRRARWLGRAAGVATVAMVAAAPASAEPASAAPARPADEAEAPPELGWSAAAPDLRRIYFEPARLGQPARCDVEAIDYLPGVMRLRCHSPTGDTLLSAPPWMPPRGWAVGWSWLQPGDRLVVVPVRRGTPSQDAYDLVARVVAVHDHRPLGTHEHTACLCQQPSPPRPPPSPPVVAWQAGATVVCEVVGFDYRVAVADGASGGWVGRVECAGHPGVTVHFGSLESLLAMPSYGSAGLRLRAPREGDWVTTRTPPHDPWESTRD
jgi:hypothetical protein